MGGFGLTFYPFTGTMAQDTGSIISKTGGDDLDDGLELDPDLLASSEPENGEEREDDLYDDGAEGDNDAGLDDENDEEEAGAGGKKRKAAEDLDDEERKAEKKRRKKEKEKARKAKVS
jgi:protein CMS1